MSNLRLAMRRSSCALVVSTTCVLLLACSPVGWESPNHGTYFRVKPHSAMMLEGRTITLRVETDAEVNTGVFRIDWRVNPWSAPVGVEHDDLGREATLTTYSAAMVYVVAEHVSFGERCDSALVTIRHVTPQSLEITPDHVAMAVGEMEWISGVIRDSVGVRICRTASEWKWTLSDSSVVTIESEGSGICGRSFLVKGAHVGETIATAEVEGLIASARVIVE